MKSPLQLKFDLSLRRELLEEKYKGKLLSRYEAPQHSVLAQIFRGLSGKKVVTPSRDFSRYADFSPAHLSERN